MCLEVGRAQEILICTAIVGEQGKNKLNFFMVVGFDMLYNVQLRDVTVGSSGVMRLLLSS